MEKTAFFIIIIKEGGLLIGIKMITISNPDSTGRLQKDGSTCPRNRCSKSQSALVCLPEQSLLIVFIIIVL